MATCPHCQDEHPQHEPYCPTTGRAINPELRYPPGTLLAEKYRLGNLLGVGGMGLVYEATHLLLDDRVAVKLLLPELVGDRQMTARILREGRAASAIRHPSIVMVTDMDYTEDGALFVVMEYVEGVTLKDVIDREGPLSLARASQLVTQALAGLEVAHKKGIVHRDLKPENLMVVAGDDGEQIKILDFGIAKRVSEKDPRLELTQAGLVMGTPQFMAPEQARGLATLDHRADLYAMGAILYNCLAGEPALTGDDYTQILVKILEGDVPPLTSRRAELPTEIDAVVAQAMATRPEERFPDARSFRDALAPFLPAAVTSPHDPSVLAIPMARPHEAPAVESPIGGMMEDLSADSLVSLDDRLELATEVEEPSPAPPAESAAAITPPAAAAPAPDLDPHLFRPRGEKVEEDLDLAIQPFGSRRAAPSADDDLGTSRPAYADIPAAPPSLAAREFADARRAKAKNAGRVRWVIISAVALVAIWGAVEIYDAVFAKPPPPVAKEQQFVTITIETDPKQAEIYVDRVRSAGNTSHLPLSSRLQYTFEVRARGYVPQRFAVTPNRDQLLVVSLTPRPQ